MVKLEPDWVATFTGLCNWNGIDKKTKKFIDVNSTQALVAHYALVEQLKELRNSFLIIDPISEKALIGGRLRDAWNAAGEAKVAFDFSVIKNASEAFMDLKGFSEDQYNNFIKRTLFRKAVKQLKNASPDDGF